MRSLLRLLKKEKSTLINLFVTPIAGLLIVCYVYSNVYIEHIPFAIVDNDNSSLSRSIISQLKNHPGLDVNTYASSESELEEKIKTKEVAGGIIIPENFSQDMTLKKSPKALIIADGTNMSLGGNALSYASTVVGTLSAGVQLSILQGNNLYPYVASQTIGNFSFVERLMYDPQGSYIRNLAYTVAPFTLQMVFLTEFFVPLLIEKKKYLSLIKIRSKEGLKSILDIIARLILVSTVGIIASFIALCILGKVFSLPLKGDIIIFVALMYVFVLNITAMGLFIASFLKKINNFFQMYLMSNLLCILTTGIFYPLYMMPEWLVKLIKSVWPFIHVAVPLKALNLKGVGWEATLPYIQSSLKYAAFWLPVGLLFYSASIFIGKCKHIISDDISISHDLSDKNINSTDDKNSNKTADFMPTT